MLDVTQCHRMQAAFRWEKFKTHQEIVLSISLHDMRKEQEGQ